MLEWLSWAQAAYLADKPSLASTMKVLGYPCLIAYSPSLIVIHNEVLCPSRIVGSKCRLGTSLLVKVTLSDVFSPPVAN